MRSEKAASRENASRCCYGKRRQPHQLPEVALSLREILIRGKLLVGSWNCANPALILVLLKLLTPHISSL